MRTTPGALKGRRRQGPLWCWGTACRARGVTTYSALRRPFAAHEVLEARWKTGPAEERDLWQGLAQLCVGLTHASRGNSVGALRLVERGAGRLGSYGTGGGPTYGLDLTAVVACARGQAAKVDDG